MGGVVIHLILNVVIALMSVVAWLQMALTRGHAVQELATTGLKSLKYFTVLSNLFSGLTSFVFVVFFLMGKAPPYWLLVAKLASATSVMLTFFTVLLFLGPTMGWANMYKSGNLWMHLVLPLLAAIDCCTYAPMRSLPLSSTFVALVPVILYGIVYIARVVILGTVRDGKTIDFYGFARGGVQSLPLITGVMLVGTWFIALVLKLI